MSLVLEDSHEIRGLLLRARASDHRFALSSPEQHSGPDNLLWPSVLNSKETIMEVLHQRCAGMDISKRDAKVCVRTPGTRHNTFVKVVTVSGAMTKDILVLRDYLLAEQVTLVVMEATGDYWRPFYYLLDPALTVMLVNAAHVKHVPGRKTDLLTELASWCSSWCVRDSAGAARFRRHDQRRGYAAGVVRAGGAAARLA